MLTREQVMALSGREFDAAVAEYVFGRTKIGYYGPPADPAKTWTHIESVRYDTEAEAEAAYQRYYDARYPDKPFGIVAPDQFYADLCGWKEGWGPLAVHDYGTDANCDYVVLCHVRQTWDDNQQKRFWQELSCLLSNRNYGRIDDVSRFWLATPLYTLSAYIVGDYARAALLVLTEAPK